LGALEGSFVLFGALFVQWRALDELALPAAIAAAVEPRWRVAWHGEADRHPQRLPYLLGLVGDREIEAEISLAP
jgi:hypothetical protein